MRSIEELILEFQQTAVGTTERDYVTCDILEALATDKKDTVKWLRHKLPASIDLADLVALYDDAAYEAMLKFEGSKGACFTTFLHTILQSKSKNVLSYCNAQKRKEEETPLSFDMPAAEGNATFADVCEDLAVLTGTAILEGTETVAILEEYSNISQSKALNASIVLIECDLYSKILSKQQRIKALFKQDISAEAMKKRRQRALKDFAKFYKEKTK